MYWKTRLKNIMNSSKNFIVFLFRRAQNDTIFRVSASLSYTSLIAIVPLFAIGLAIFSAFPGFNAIKEQFQDFILKNFTNAYILDIILRWFAPVAQWIEHWPPEPGALVRFQSGVFLERCFTARCGGAFFHVFDF